MSQSFILVSTPLTESSHGSSSLSLSLAVYPCWNAQAGSPNSFFTSAGVSIRACEGRRLSALNHEQTAEMLKSQLLVRDALSKRMTQANEWTCSQTQADTERVETSPSAADR